MATNATAIDAALAITVSRLIRPTYSREAMAARGGRCRFVLVLHRKLASAQPRSTASGAQDRRFTSPSPKI
jgi:hypothetical protein